MTAYGTTRKCWMARRMSPHRRKPDLSRDSLVYSFPEENLIDWMHTPGDPRPGPGAPTPAPLHPLKPLSVPQHVHRERLLLRQVRSIDELRILDAIGADEDGIVKMASTIHSVPKTPKRPELRSR